MKKPSDTPGTTVEDLLGLGQLSARKNYYPELSQKLDELEAERNRYKWLFDNALHGIFQADLEGRILAANPAMASLCGYTTPELLMQHVCNMAEQLFANPAEYAHLLQRLRQDGKLFRYETRLLKAQGVIIHVSMNVLLKQAHGQETLEAFVQDITERVHDQARLHKLNEELEGRVRERTRALAEVNQKLWEEIREREQTQHQLEIAKEQAEAANHSKDKYLAAASHDLLQPMNAARLLVATLRERPLPEPEHHLVERVHIALEGAEELLADLLEISKLDQNAVKPDHTTFSLQSLFEALETEFQPTAERAGLRLRVRPTTTQTHTDPRLLMRILRNFVSNALRYTNYGGVLVGCRLRQGALELQVWDSGEGIPEERLAEIFGEFSQLEQHRNGMRTGVGLGLAIVDRIAKVLEHPIQVRSTPDKGSMFSICVPFVEQPPQPSAVFLPETSSGVFDQQHILIIDNDHDILMSMRMLLNQWGLRTCLATDASTAIEQCRTYQIVPDAVLLDYHLNQGKTGLEALAELKEALPTPFPAAMLTAERSDDTLQAFKNAGLQVLHKPVRPGKLRALLSHMLATH